MIKACVTRTAVYHLHLSWEERLRAHAVPLWSPDGMTRIHIHQDQSWGRSGFRATPSEVWGSSVCTAPQSNLLSRRSQLTLSELMQNSLHSHAERTESWLRCKSSWLMLSIDNCSCAACGWHRAQYKSHVPEQCWADVPKGTVHR